MNQEEGNTENMSKRKQGRRSNGCGGLKLHGNIWYARFTPPHGKRVSISTHTSNREEALRILATYTEPYRKSKSEEEIKLRLQQSLDIMELQREVAKVERTRLDELVEKFLTHRNLADATSGTLLNYKHHLNALLEAVKKIKPNAVFMDEVTMEVADAAMGELTKKYTPASYNLALATLRRCWDLFSPRNNPFMKISKRKLDKSRHRKVISEDDIRRIFNACRDDVERAVWGVGFYAGLREGDICNLNYGALSSDMSTLTWLPQKTKRHMPEPLVIPVAPPLKALLSKVLKWHMIGNEQFKDEPLWADYKRRYATGVSDFFKRTLEKAGLKSSLIDEDGHRKVLTGFHITRLAFVTFASKYMSPFLVQKIVGHAHISMTAHYFQTQEDDMRKGLDQMPDFTGNNPPIVIKTEEEQIALLLDEVRREGESKLDCLKRLITSSVRVAG